MDNALDLFAASWLPILFATLAGFVTTLLAVVAVLLVAECLAAGAGQRRRREMSMHDGMPGQYGAPRQVHGRLPAEYEPVTD
jgi:uncharacterized membrane protein